jgi:hypothetical protein
VVEAVRFESADPAFSGEMIVVTTLTRAPGGVTVEIRCENPPIGIGPADHEAGIAAALENLASFTE